MAGLNITNEQYRIFQQNIQERYIRIELLNYQYQTVDELRGWCLEGNISIDANADIRRSATMSLVIDSQGFDAQSGSRIWLDKYIKIWIGTLSLVTNEIEYVNCGMYIIDAPSYKYDASTNTLSVSLLDLMCKLNGTRNGYAYGVPTIFTAGENIREAIIDTLALGGFTKYVVEEAPDPGTIPNDLEFSQGSTIYDLLVGLRDIYPNYQMYFDIDGVFHYNLIPSGENEPIMVDDSLWNNIVMSEDMSVDFQSVKNAIEIYGRIHDPAHFSTETTVSSNTINLTIADVTAYTEDMIYGFTLTDNPGYIGASLKINELDTYPLRLEDGTTAAEIVAEEGEVYFCVQFKKTYWLWLGHLQAHGYAEDDDPNSPFYVESTVGKIYLPLYDGEYANCYSDELAQQRAEYELYLHTNMNNSITLNCTVVPWLDVNILCEYTTKRDNQTNTYMIKSISYGLAESSSMNINMVRYYPVATG